MSGEDKVRTLVDVNTWSTALEGNLTGMTSSEPAAVHEFNDFDAPGRHPDSVGYVGRGATPYTFL